MKTDGRQRQNERLLNRCRALPALRRACRFETKPSALLRLEIRVGRNVHASLGMVPGKPYATTVPPATRWAAPRLSGVWSKPPVASSAPRNRADRPNYLNRQIRFVSPEFPPGIPVSPEFPRFVSPEFPEFPPPGIPPEFPPFGPAVELAGPAVGFLRCSSGWGGFSAVWNVIRWMSE